MNQEDKHLPQCIGIIMDGNRRWAKEQNLNTLKGHQRGVEVFKESIKWLCNKNIKHGVFYAFSTENWNRTEKEVSYLLELFSRFIKGFLKELEKEEYNKNIRIRFLGDVSQFSNKLQEKIIEVEKSTEKYKDLTVWVAISYGGRLEIVTAINKVIEKGVLVTEDTFEKNLWTSGMPDPDMIIRTGGKCRLSNFLPWQSVYSELFFTKKYWPDITNENLDEFLEEYGNRVRNFGK